jgi:Ala-tRNA(Pro) deacylase
MAIAATVERSLKASGIPYELLPHAPTKSSYGSARAAHLPARQLAKGVLLKEKDKYLLAVLPASRKLDLSWLRSETGRACELASEAELSQIFPDCAPGAVPALGPAYGLQAVVERALCGQSELYFEAGDHEELVHVREADYETLIGEAEYCSFTTLLDDVGAERARPL